MTLISDVGQQISRPDQVTDRAYKARALTVALLVLLLISSVFSLMYGASGISLWAVLSDILAGRELDLRERVVLFDIRLPRMMMGILVGASLAVSGAVMQGVFRNPLADPGLVGVSAGAGLGAIAAIVLSAYLPVSIAALFGNYTVPFTSLYRRLGRDHVAVPRCHPQRAHLGRHHVAGGHCPWRTGGRSFGHNGLHGG